MDIVEFLVARLDEEQQLAKMASRTGSGRLGGHWKVDCKCVGLCSDDCEESRIQGDNITIYDEGGHDNWQAQHIARWDPARVLADVEAKRHFLEWCVEVTRHFDWAQLNAAGCLRDDPNPRATHTATLAMQTLAAPYAAHPDFDPAWAVDAPH